MTKFSIAVLVSTFLSFFYTSPEGTVEDVQELEWASDTLVLSSLTNDPPPNDTSKTKKNPNDRRGDPTRQTRISPLHLDYPSNYSVDYRLKEDMEGYEIYERIGNTDIRYPSHISFEDYLEYNRKKKASEFFREKAMSSNEENQQGLQLDIDIEELEDIFGGGKISIRPTGFATLRLSLDRNRNDSEQLNIQQQNPPPFLNFQQDIQVGVIGQIGEKLRLNVNFDTQATFDFEDELKLAHKGTEDQIIQEIEAGNVSMQVGNSLMQGRQNLFGLKTKLRFGPVYVSGIASFERGQVETVRVAGGGAIETPFEKEVTEYDANRHFFLSHFFRSVYEDALDNLPVVQSRLQINQVEIWVERQGFTRNNRNAVGFLDLGENELPIAGGQGVVYNENIQSSTANSDRYPSNESNDLYDILENTPAARDITTTRNAVEGLSNLRMVNTEDFEVLGNMRRLEPNEYKINTKLGYVSLNTPLRSDQVLFVAYNYTLDGEVKQVGEFSNEIPVNQDNTNVLFLKMLRPSVTRVSPYPGWDLMMKNIYQIAFGIKQDDFFLDVRFETGTSAGKVNYLPNSPVDNKPLIQVLGVDNVTNNTAPGPDNYFDFINGYTVDTDKGTVIFPKLEPFGSHLEEQLANDPEAIENYVFDQLYRNTQASARQNGPQFRYSIEGYFRSAGNSEIPLNTFQLKEGGVIVTAGGRQLTEGQDYTVDYFGGKVIIINQSILNSGQEIEVSYENSQLYSLQTRRLLGSRAEYSPSKDLSLGLTILNLREQPINQKQILGQEPINNTLWGFDAAFNRESGFLTKAIDKLPLITTKAPSSFIGSAEFAQFLPGAPNQTKLRDQDGNVIDNGIVYLDDFESSTPPFTLMNTSNWFLASYPEGNPDVFDPRTVYNNPRSANYNRGKLAWYSIDQVFYNARANEVPDADQENNYTRKIEPTEIFPQASLPIGNIFQRTFDLRYDPRLRGPYNYQVDPTRVSSNGLLSQPDENWAGVMRVIDLNNDFEATNVEFIEFWMMDPFDAKDGNPFSDGGEMYFNLGLVSEEILPDGIVSRENALPSPSDPNLPIDSLSPWGKIPILTPLTETFVNNPEDRLKQDVGLDGLPTEEEVTFFSDVIDTLSQFLTPAALNRYETDPSSDNYTSYRDPELRDSTASILRRYFDFNGQDGNTPVRNSAQEENSNLSLQATSLPDQEDINRNGSLNFTEQYWQYRIRMNPDSLVPGQNFVVDTVRSVANIGRGQTTEVTWYQFRIPIRSGTAVNGISNFQSINFMRMYMTGFRDPVIMRMTEFQLVSSQWIRFNGELAEEGVVVTPTEANETTFELGQVSRERNSQKLPYNYVLPPGIIRQQLGVNTFSQQVEDERSLVMRVCKLTDGDARGMYKITRNDLRQYERLKMFVHAEPFSPDNGLTPSNFEQPGDAMVFIRLGLDNDQNYYEYEMPLSPSDPAFPNLRENVWLPENEFDIDLAAFAGAKSRRGTSFGQIYRYRDTVGLPEGHAIIIKGTPKLSDVRNIMVGVRNPEDGNTEPLCMEVWVNELRLTNFTQNSGVAAKFNGSATLADLATFRVNGQYKSAGFGPLEQKLSNRPQEEELRYDLEANVNVDKVFPKNWGMSLPVTVRYSRAERTPLFNPQEADVSVDRLLEALPRDTAQARLREIQDFKQTRSIALTNWRINPTQSASKKPGAKPKPKPKKSEGGGSKQKTKMPWSITNFNATYAYVETQARNATIASQLNTQHRGALGYRYNFPKVNVKPFAFISKVKPLNSTVGFLSKFAINPLPANVQVSVNGNRQFEERILRVIGDGQLVLDPLYAKNFLINRNYTLNWPIFPSLQVNFTAANIARVDEVRGRWEDATQEERDSLAGNFLNNLIFFGRDTVTYEKEFTRMINFGRNTQYNHTLNAAYQLPFSQMKLLNWINGNISYTGTFNWMQAPEISPSLGATISNTQAIQASVRMDLNNLYRKVKPLRKVLEAQNKRNQNQRQQTTVRQPPPNGDTEAEQDSTNKPDPFWFLKQVGNQVIRIALSVRSIDLSYNRNSQTMLPGYLPETDNFGLDFNTGSPILPPTLGFVFGSQTDIRGLAGENGWITTDTTLANLFNNNFSDNLTARTSLELFKDFRIDLSANRTSTLNKSAFFRFDPSTGGFDNFDPLTTGNFNMSYIFANSAFEQEDPRNPNSQLLRQFSNNRTILSRRYAEANPETADLDNEQYFNFRNGYLGSNQDVMITAFLSTYGLIGPERIELSSQPLIPLPNWSINYTGLGKIPFLKKKFNGITIKHTYRGTYTIGTFNNSLFFRDDDGDGFADTFNSLDTLGLGFDLKDAYSEFFIQGVQVSEQFSPLIGVNFTMKNGFNANIDYKRGRQISLNVGNLQVIESKNQDIAVMFRYRKDKLNWFFRLFGRDFNLENTANFSFQMTARDTREIIRRIPGEKVGGTGDFLEDVNRGGLNLIFEPRIDYTVSKRVSAQVFYKYNLSNPYTEVVPKTSFSSVGFQIRFSLAN